MNSRIVAEVYIDSLQRLADDGRLTRDVYVPGRLPSTIEIGPLIAAGFADSRGITEKGLAALDQIRKRHPAASPFVFYRPAPEDWTD